MSSQNTLIALVAGAALGALAGVLLAPASGEETRKKLKKSGEGLRDQLTDLLKQGKDLLDEAGDATKDATAKASKAVQGTMDNAKGTYQQAKAATDHV